MPFVGFSDGTRIAPIAAPKRHLRVLGFVLAATIVSVLLAAPSASADVATVSVDTLRTGWDSNEPSLAPSAVSASDFGQLFAANVDGQVYGQPIVAGGTLVAATENNKVYGLDPGHWRTAVEREPGFGMAGGGHQLWGPDPEHRGDLDAGV